MWRMAPSLVAITAWTRERIYTTMQRPRAYVRMRDLMACVLSQVVALGAIAADVVRGES